MSGKKWELKSPKTDKLTAIERNLKRASKQSANIVIDTGRLKKIHDATVQNLLIHKLKQQRTIKRLILVDRKRRVIDINRLI
jgi:DNA-binding sugar fermentation-stimulating protein